MSKNKIEYKTDYTKDIIAANRCDCRLCLDNNKRRWQMIENCQCTCHDSDQPSGHDGLCCEFPNGRKKENPFIVN